MKLFITLKERCKLKNVLRVKVVFNSLKGEFWNGCISFNIGPIKTKIENVANLNVLFLWVFFASHKKGLVPSPSRFETRQCSFTGAWRDRDYWKEFAVQMLIK